MWKKLKLRLGKIVQGVLNIFRKKKPKKETITMETKGFTDENGITFGPGAITLTPTEKYGAQPITIYWEDDSITKLNRGSRAELNLYEDACDKEVYEELLKMLNTYEQVLPKRIEVPTLLVSCYANWEYDSIGVDLSRIEEGIAHYWCTSTKNMEEYEQEYCERHDVEEFLQEEEAVTAIVKDAVLFDWGNGMWTWE